MGTRVASRRAPPRAGSTRRARAGPRRAERRDEPDQELRREHLSERDERDERRRAPANELVSRAGPPQPDPDEHSCLHEAEQRRRVARSGRVQVLRAVARAISTSSPNSVGGELEPRAEALDLERPRELVCRCCARPRRAHTRTGGTRRRRHLRGSEADDRLAPARVGATRRRRRAERAPPGTASRRPQRRAHRTRAGRARDEGRERPGDEHCGPEIEAREHDRAEQRAESTRQSECADVAPLPSPAQRDRRQQHRARRRSPSATRRRPGTPPRRR